MEDAEIRIAKLVQIIDELREQIEELREQQTSAQETLQAIRRGEIDALVVQTDQGERIFTLEGVDYVYRLLVEQMGEGAATVSSLGIILYSNQKFATLLGYSLEKVIGCQLEKFVSPKDFPKFKIIWQHCQTEIAITQELLLMTADGSEIPVQLSITQLSIDNISIYCIIITDLTDYKRKERALRESEERFRKSFLDSPFPMIIHTEDGEIIEINQAWTELTGYRIDDMPMMANWLERAFEKSQEMLVNIEQLFQINQQINPREFTIRTRQGENRVWNFNSLPLGSFPDDRKTIFSIACDVTDRNRAEELLRRNALYDTLTGLPNRILLMDRIEQSIERLKREKDYLFAVLFLDLDRFKLINDSLGHEMGDKILIASAEKFSQCVRVVDTVARLGGDEFIMLLQDLKSEIEAIQIANRILTSLNSPILIESQEFFISASIGIAFSSTEISLATELLRNADLAMYEAKHQGKACYQIFKSTLYDRTSRLLELETSLSQALKHQEFILNYQPIISLTTSNLVGFEALVRWKHPQKGLISPAEFIPVAEETGLIIPLSEWIFSEACSQMKVWQEQFENAALLRMSLNVSGRQLHESNCVEEIDKILTATGLKGNSLKLEITESLVMDNRESFGYFLTEMRKRGIQLSIDDFGTGYSSLSYLHRLPFNTIKIDRSFINNISSEADSVKIVQAIITLAHHLSLDVIAEGIETQEQLRILQDLGCDFGQGYFFARPLDAEAAKGLLIQG